MKALSLQQPWAGAIAHLGKNVENRRWLTNHRGPLAIHASAGSVRRLLEEDAVRAVAAASGQQVSDVQAATKPRGAIVAVATITDVCADSRHTPDLVCDCGPWALPSHLHFLLGGIAPLNTPVAATGQLSLWHLPADVEAAVAAQVGGR